MSKHNRIRKRHGERQENNPQPRPRFMEPPPNPLPFLSRILCPGYDPPPPPPPPEAGAQETTETGGGSRYNSLKHSIRSKILFPFHVKAAIDDLARDFSRQLLATGKLQEWCVFEMARSSVQADLANDQLLVDGVRAVDQVGTSWDDLRTAHTNKLAAKLTKEPHRIAAALGATKHGTLYLLKQWLLISDIIESNGALDEPQRQIVYDLLGIDHVFRNGGRQVPAGSDKPALAALVERETGRLRANLERRLNDRDKTEQGMAMLSIVKERSPETRMLRSDLARARKRLSWAWEALEKLQRGVDPSTIIDPDTHRPVAPGPKASAAPEPASAAAAPPPPPETAAPQETAPASPVPPPLPEGLSPEAREMWQVAAGAILSKTATRPAAEAEPPPAA